MTFDTSHTWNCRSFFIVINHEFGKARVTAYECSLKDADVTKAFLVYLILETLQIEKEQQELHLIFGYIHHLKSFVYYYHEWSISNGFK